VLDRKEQTIAACFFSFLQIVVVLKKSIQLNEQSVSELYADTKKKKMGREERRAANI